MKRMLPEQTNTYDIVITGGRVIDPDSHLDAIRNLGISNGAIVEISDGHLSGHQTLDATNLIVAPGFIDLHTHTPTIQGQCYQALDGVTTALDLEGGAYPVTAYGLDIAEQPLINYGASIGYKAIRLKVFDGVVAPDLTSDLGRTGKHMALSAHADVKQLELLRQGIEDGAATGGLGIGLLLDYMSEAISTDEIRMLFQTASDLDLTIFVHVRRGVKGDIEGLREMLSNAISYNTSVHICHVNASAMGSVEHWLELLSNAADSGLDVTTELFPYTAGSTSISSAVFQRDWREIFGIDYKDVQWAKTGERLTAKTWEHYQRTDPAGYVIHHYMQERWIQSGLRWPDVIVASDAMPLKADKKGVPPNGMGTFTRVLGRYCRDLNVLTLNDALARMTILPARRLETVSRGFSRKGRISVGSDADLTIFDFNRIADNATYEEPLMPASGIVHVLVGGQFAVKYGQLQEGATIGKRLLSNRA